jgi:hypothetical protein
MVPLPSDKTAGTTGSRLGLPEDAGQRFIVASMPVVIVAAVTATGDADRAELASL